MIDVITKIFCALLCGLSIAYTTSRINNYKIKKLPFLFCTLIVALLTYISYKVEYNSEMLILRIIICIFIIKYIFKINTSKSIIITLLTMILMSIGEIIVSICLINFLTISDVRNNLCVMVLCNTMVAVIMVTLVKIPLFNRKMKYIINKIENKNMLKTIILLVLSIIVIAYLLYNISINYKLNDKYYITIAIMISYVIITIIFFRDKFEHMLLEEKYDALFDYFSEISESIDDLNLTAHEYKNQIAIVGNYIENKKYKKAKEYINDISNIINKDEGLLVNLTDIPTGGLKGLLYYKIIVAKNQKVEIILDVGRNIKPLFKDLTEKESKIVTRIIGVYIDNAISASSKKNKTVNIEIYNLNDCLNFVISNKVDKDFNLSKLGKKGFSTKGKGHGQGLYLINKLINRNRWLNSEYKLVNDYYISKLIIDTKNIGK